MKNSEELRQQLRSINRKSYPAYKGLKGLYHFVYELSTGQWAGKYSNEVSYNHGFINPSLNEVGQWKNIVSNLQTYYMAIKVS